MKAAIVETQNSNASGRCRVDGGMVEVFGETLSDEILIQFIRENSKSIRIRVAKCLFKFDKEEL